MTGLRDCEVVTFKRVVIVLHSRRALIIMQSRRSLGNSVVGVLIAACLLASAVNCISAPSFIHPCHSIDPVCLTKAANEAVDGYTNGIPELGIPLLDPYYIDRLEFNLVGMNLTFENGTLRGLKQCVVTETRTNLEERYSYSKFVCDITLKGKYSANGNILIFAIQGEGRAKLEIKSMEFESTSYWNIITKEDGKKYLDLIKDEVKYDIKEYMHFTLSNLFNGNKELSEAVHTFLNENWKQVFDEFGGPMVKYSIDLARNNLKKFFNGIPAHELLAIDEFL